MRLRKVESFSCILLFYGQLRDYVDGRCDWDTYLLSHACDERKHIVNNSMKERNISVSDRRITDFIAGTSNFINSNALADELLHERFLGEPESRCFSPNVTPEPHISKDSGWNEVQLFITSGRGDVIDILSKTQAAGLLKRITLDEKLASRLQKSCGDFAVLLTRLSTQCDQRKESLNTTVDYQLILYQN